jgi:CheY-like chemotaxis protein
MVIADRVVLVAEDDPGEIQVVRDAFQRLHLANPVEVVSDGRAAIDYLDASDDSADRRAHPRPVLILLDSDLAKPSGREVLGWLRAQERLRRIPVVMLISSDERPHVDVVDDLGVNSSLRKPVSFDALVRMLTRIDISWMMLNEPPGTPAGRPGSSR